MWSFRQSELTGAWILEYDAGDGIKCPIIRIPHTFEQEVAGLAIDLEKATAQPIKSSLNCPKCS